MNLFLPEKLGTLPLSNHFLRSGVPEGLALKSGAPHARLDEHYLQLIEGQASTIICGPISVTATSQPGLLSLHSIHQLASYRRLTDAVHEKGGLILARLSYPAAQQENPGEAYWRLLRSAERSFSHAAAKAKEAGFDGIQLDFTFYSLPGCFLSRRYNQREDEYGGEIHARIRFPRDLYRAARQAVGPDYPVWVCLETDVNLISVQDLLTSGQYLASAGVSAIEVCGDFPPPPPAPGHIGLPKQLHPAEMLSRIVPVPVVMTAGLNTTLEMMQSAGRSKIRFFGLNHQLEEDPAFITRMIR